MFSRRVTVRCLNLDNMASRVGVLVLVGLLHSAHGGMLWADVCTQPSIKVGVMHSAARLPRVPLVICW